MKVIAVNGYSNTGKTTTIEALVKVIKMRGLTVGTIKNIYCSDINMDEEGTDSYRHMAAGADVVTARTPSGTYIMHQQRLGIEDIIDSYNVDILLVEGGYELSTNNIVAGATVEDLLDLCDEQTLSVIGRISNETKTYKGYPVINALSDPEKLVQLIIDEADIYIK